MDSTSGTDPGLAADDPARYLRALVQATLEERDREEARLLMSLMARDGLLDHVATFNRAVFGRSGAPASS